MYSSLGPNEISIFHPAAIQELDVSKNETTKDVWYDVLKPFESAVFTRDEGRHKEWRKSWSQGVSVRCKCCYRHALPPRAALLSLFTEFSVLGMNEYRKRIAELAQMLSQSISDYEGAPVDIDEVMSWFSFDAMGEVLFGEDFGLTRSKTMHPGIVHRDRALSILAPLEGAIWIAQMGFTLAPFLGKVKDWFKMVAFCDEQTNRRMQVRL